MTLPVVWSDDCLLHVPGGEVWVGVRTPGTEVPGRLEVLRAALAGAGHPFVPATAHGDEPVLAVHDAALLDYLADAYTGWTAAGFPEDPGQDRVVGYLFPTPGLLSGLPMRTPTAAHARVGRFCYDTMTLIGPGTYPAARAAADAALTAVDLIRSGARAAYAASRPPGHHVTRDAFGGSCYLNNAAIAAQALRSVGHDRVAVIDVDAHHANGTQSIFYDRSDVLVASVHVDPGAGWFPHYLGFTDETGRGAGEGTNLNLPLPEGTGDPGWLAAVGAAVEAVARFDPGAVVLSLGVDAAADDPESPLRVTAEGYRDATRQVAALGVPVVAVQEGGYHLPTLGRLVATALEGLAG
ncbi:MAG: histone deacetylase family protein [Candidatus Nanopelagicales bacterium]